MADESQWLDAIRTAHESGDFEGAQRLADLHKQEMSHDSSEYSPPKPKTPDTIRSLAKEAGKDAPSMAKAVAGAVTETPLSMATSIAAQPVAGIAGLARTGYGLVAGEDFDEATRKGAETVKGTQSALTYSPKTVGGKLTSELLAPVMEAPKKAGGYVGGAIGEAVNGEKGRIAGESIGEGVVDAGMSLAGFKGGRVAAAKAGDLASSGVARVLPKISAEDAAIAQKGMEMGVTPNLHDIYHSEGVKTVGEILNSVPVASTKKANKVALNKTMIDAIGGDVSKDLLTRDVWNKARLTSGKKIGDAFSGTDMPFEAIAPVIADITDNMRGSTKDVRRTVKQVTDDLERIAKDNDGVISGDDLKDFNSSLSGKMRNAKANPATVQALDHLLDLRDGILDHVRETLTDTGRAEFDQARKQYAIAQTLKPLVAKSERSGIDPDAIRGLITATSQGKDLVATGKAGVLGDIADVSGQLASDTNTAFRALGKLATAGKVGAAGAVASVSPTAAGIGAGVAGLYNKLGPSVARKVIERSLPEKTAASAPIPAEPPKAQPRAAEMPPDATPTAPEPDAIEVRRHTPEMPRMGTISLRDGIPGSSVLPPVGPSKQVHIPEKSSPKIDSEAALKKAFASGKLKVGDIFLGPDGIPRKLTKEPK